MATKRRSSIHFNYSAIGSTVSALMNEKAVRAFVNDGIFSVEDFYRYNSDTADEKFIVQVEPDTPPDRLHTLVSVLKKLPKVDTDKLCKFFTGIADLHTAPAMLDGSHKPKSLAELALGLRLLFKHAKHAWLLTKPKDKHTRGVMYAPLSIAEVIASGGYREERPQIELELGYNIHGRFAKREVPLHPDQLTLRSFTVLQHLNDAGFVLPTTADIKAYAELHARYTKYAAMDKEQVWVRGVHPQAGGKYWWANDDVSLTVREGPSKAILELSYIAEDADEGMRTVSKGLEFLPNRPLLFGEPRHETLLIPTHPVLKIFSLLQHELYWVNVADMKAYVYDEEVQDKLVLPKSHVKLLDALVTDLDVMAGEDEEAPTQKRSRIFQGKAQSKVILLQGPPGVGKTLTAEVYSERIQRPLYEVACGQLGADPEEMEKRLGDILARSYALNAPLLLNEADVFIRKRGNDFDQNAIITVFLRLLEYHEGLIFLTTNRGEDVDDALLSRCIAIIQCNPPETVELRAKLWSVLTNEFGKQMPPHLCEKAARLFPKAVGRDIQNLLQLVRRVCKAHGEPVTLQALADYAVFRGIEVDTTVLEK